MRKTATIALALAATALLVPGAAAHTTHYASKIKLEGVVPHKMKRGGNYEAIGKVKSDKAACVGDRKVKAYKMQPGKDLKLGSATTLSSGDYSVSLVDEDYGPGRYYTKVTRRNIGTGGHEHICDADTSNVAKVGSIWRRL